MYPIVIIVKDLTHYIIIIGIAFILVIIAEYYKKMHPKISSLAPPMIFRILKNGINVKVLFIKQFQTKFYQNRTRNKEVIAILVMG